jgi:sugar transferase (PEP-CTERM system associated)
VIKLFDAYFPARTLLLALTESLLIFFAMILAVFLRFGPDADLTLNYQQGFVKVAVVCAVCILSLYYFDLYNSLVVSNPREVLTRLAEVLGVVCLITSAFYYLYPPAQLGRGIFLIGITLVGVSLIASRKFFFVLNRSARFADRAILLGDGPLARSLAAEVERRPELGIRLAGYVGLTPQADAGPNFNGLPLIGKLEDLVALVKRQRIGRIIVAMKDRRSAMPVTELLDLRLQGVQVEDGGKFLERISGKIEVDQLHPSWLIFSEGFRLHPAVLAMQRLIGIIVALLLLLVMSPFLPLIYLVIKLTSPGPVLYRQKRVGKNGIIFHCYKFRTMRADAEADSGATWASDSDPRIIPVGRYLRLLRFDEIPQLWNVFRGDMNFVGPRPERPEFDALLKSEIPYYGLRQIVRPGITGWAQINCGYGASVEESKEKMRHDLYYIKNISLPLDLLIIFQTIKTVIFRRGAR